MKKLILFLVFFIIGITQTFAGEVKLFDGANPGQYNENAFSLFTDDIGNNYYAFANNSSLQIRDNKGNILNTTTFGANMGTWILRNDWCSVINFVGDKAFVSCGGNISQNNYRSQQLYFYVDYNDLSNIKVTKVYSNDMVYGYNVDTPFYVFGNKIWFYNTCYDSISQTFSSDNLCGFSSQIAEGNKYIVKGGVQKYYITMDLNIKKELYRVNGETKFKFYYWNSSINLWSSTNIENFYSPFDGFYTFKYSDNVYYVLGEKIYTSNDGKFELLYSNFVVGINNDKKFVYVDNYNDFIVDRFGRRLFSVQNINNKEFYYYKLDGLYYNDTFSGGFLDGPDGGNNNGDKTCEDVVIPNPDPVYFNYISTNNYVTKEETFTEKSYLSFECVEGTGITCHSSTDNWDKGQMGNLVNAFSTGGLNFTGRIGSVVGNFYAPNLGFSTSNGAEAFDKYNGINGLSIDTDDKFPGFYIYECKDFSSDPVYFVADENKPIIPIGHKDNFVTYEELGETKHIYFSSLFKYSSICLKFNNTNQIYNFKFHFFTNNPTLEKKEVCKDKEGNYYINDEYIGKTDDDVKNYYINKNNGTLPNKENSTSGICSGNWGVFDFLRSPLCYISQVLDNIYTSIKNFSLTSIFKLNSDFIKEPTEEDIGLVETLKNKVISIIPGLENYVGYLNFYMPTIPNLNIVFPIPKISNTFGVTVESQSFELGVIKDTLGVNQIPSDEMGVKFFSILFALLYIVFRFLVLGIIFGIFYFCFYWIKYFHSLFLGGFINSNRNISDGNIISLIVSIVIIVIFYGGLGTIFVYIVYFTPIFTIITNYGQAIFSFLMLSFGDYSYSIGFINVISTFIYSGLGFYFIYLLVLKYGRLN